MKNLCKDCKYYLGVDVFKGICKKTKKEIIADNTDEKCYEPNKMCKFCSNFTYTEGKEHLGTCMEKTIAYPDMIAVTCRNYFSKK